MVSYHSILLLFLLGCVISQGTQEPCTPTVPQCLPALASYLQGQENLMKSVQKELQETKAKLNQAIGTWPTGSYCILANGTCPAGFTRHAGKLVAISQHQPSDVTAATFGDSKISCHGSCGQFGQWIGEIHLTACCK